MKLPWFNTKEDAQSPVFSGNTWNPADNELAVFFGVSSLSGWFAKNVVVPPGTQAFLFRDGAKPSEAVPEGTYNLDNFIGRVGRLFSANEATKVLICRTATLPVPFVLDAVETLERLPVRVEFNLGVRIDDPERFHARFMVQAGAVNTDDVAKLLRPAMAAEARRFLAKHSIEAWQTQANLLTEQFCAALLAEAVACARRLDLGIGCRGVDLVEVTHPVLKEFASGTADLWLAGKRQAAERAKRSQLREVYKDDAMDRIARQAIDDDLADAERRRQRQGATRRGTDALDDLEQEAAFIERRLAINARIRAANSKAELDDRQARIAAEALEASVAANLRDADTENKRWQHVQALAEVEQKSELSAKRILADRRLEIMRLEGENELQTIRIRNEIAQSSMIGDAQEKLASQERATRIRDHQDLLNAALNDARSEALVVAVKLDTQRAVDAAEREKKLAAAKDDDDIARSTMDRLFGHLERFNEMDRREQEHERKLKWEDEEWQWEIDRKRRAAALEEERQRFEHDMRALDVRNRHELALLDKEVDRIKALGSVDDMTKLATADASNAATLAEVMKAQQEANMKPEALLARAAATSPQAAEAVKAFFAAASTMPANSLFAAQPAGANSMSLNDVLALQQSMMAAQQQQRERETQAQREHELKIGDQRIREIEVIMRNTPSAQPFPPVQPAYVAPAASNAPTVNVNIPPVQTGGAGDRGVGGAKFCPGCGKPAAPDARFCGYCARALS